MTDGVVESTIQPSVGDEDSAKGGWRVDVADASSSVLANPNSDSCWLSHSAHTRRRFQTLLQRFYSQLSYGCSEPSCKTPTCLSFRKRVTKGPLRPYTVLSARALAAFLASQKQPEKNLCEHVSRKLSNLLNDSSRPDHLGNDFETPSEPLTRPRIQVESKASSELLEVSKTEDRQKDVKARIEEQLVQSVDIAGVRREKDLKSFAQVLFDTNAMRRLYLDDSPCAVSPVSPPTLTSTFDEENDTAEQADFVASAAIPERNRNITHLKPQRKVFQSHVEHCKADEETLYQKQHLVWQASQVGYEGPQALCFESVEDLPAVTTTTLAYFSSMNVISVLAAHYEWDVDLDVYTMLHNFNRDASHLKSTKPLIEDHGQHERSSAFFRRSAAYICKTRSALLRSFVEWKQDDDGNTTARSYPLSTITSIAGCIRRFGASEAMLSSLWVSIGDVYMQSPATIGSHDTTNQLRDGQQSFSTSLNKILSNTEAAHIVKIALAVLIDTVSPVVANAMDTVEQLRSRGQMRQLYEEVPPTRMPRHMYDAALVIMDHFRDGLAMSLAVRLAKAMASRQRQTEGGIELPAREVKDRRHMSFMTLVVRNIADKRGLQVRICSSDTPPSLQDGVFQDATERLRFEGPETNCRLFRIQLWQIVDWMRAVILKEWDGNPEVPRYSAVGGAIEFLGKLYIHCAPDHTPPGIFYTPYLSDRLDILKFPVQWANRKTSRDMVHLLSYHFLFPPATLISYFRAINHYAMTRAYRSAQFNIEMLKKMNFEDKSGKRGRGEIRLLDRLRASTSKYLVLDIRRNNILEDAMNQLWRREPGELMKPLKVRMGLAEGEEGVDLGGIQQEFFRLAISEALDPKYGAFTTDATTRMSWFQPHTLEPSHMFEMVGLLTSLAIYNGLTLPFTFPRALYRKIAGLQCETIRDIEDGWPDLARGLQTLLDWSDGDVEDVFMRRYTFSVDVFGTIHDTDMGVPRKRGRKDIPDKMEEGRKLQPIDDSAPPKRSRASKGLSESANGKGADGVIMSTDNQSNSNPHTPRLPSVASQDTDNETDGETDEESPSHPPSRSHSSSSNNSSPPMVTNANRHQYVRDYIAHLTDISVQPQLSAFIVGFRRCLNRKAHHLFTEDSVKLLVEGHTVIDTHALEAITKYDPDNDNNNNDENDDNNDTTGYHTSHPTIRQFWSIVHGWAADDNPDGQAKIKSLLEFVTASDRLPVGGMSRVQFVIQRNGEGDERLPSSMTCFGRLLLPEFSGVEAMRRGLERAVVESKGFGLP